jgi:hypothetical protein
MGTRVLRVSFLSAIAGCATMACGSGSNDSESAVVSCDADGVCESLCATDPDCPPAATGGAGGDTGDDTTGGTDLGAGGTAPGVGGTVSGSGGTTTTCTNVRPTGTDWDEATCDQWASETSECDAAWMIDNHYCDESCGRCATSGLGGATSGSGGATSGSGGTTSGSGGSGTVDCNASMPTGGSEQCATYATGDAAGLRWEIWSNSGPGCITTYSTPAFSASWNNSGDFLGRVGLEWGNSGQPYTAYGTITAEFAETKSGTAGGYSYIGIYGWSDNPCVEYYIVDDSYNGMPFNPGNTTDMGTANIDGGTYTLYTRNTTGTGGSRCSGVSSWIQFYSIRQQARDCGAISITEHFDAWAAAGMTLGNLLEAKILIEAGGGTGSIDFAVANVTAQ